MKRRKRRRPRYPLERFYGCVADTSAILPPDANEPPDFEAQVDKLRANLRDELRKQPGDIQRIVTSANVLSRIAAVDKRFSRREADELAAKFQYIENQLYDPRLLTPEDWEKMPPPQRPTWYGPYEATSDTPPNT